MDVVYRRSHCQGHETSLKHKTQGADHTRRDAQERASRGGYNVVLCFEEVKGAVKLEEEVT